MYPDSQCHGICNGKSLGYCNATGVSPDTMGGSVFHRPDTIRCRDNRILWSQMENRGWFQRTEEGYRQCRNPKQTSSGSKKSFEFLHDGHFAYLDLRLSIRKNSEPTACGHGAQPLRLFRCPKTGGPSRIG
jgi:hypothetical protein